MKIEQPSGLGREQSASVEQSVWPNSVPYRRDWAPPELSEQLAKALPAAFEQKSIVVVGAGIAGLTTAHTLRKSGINCEVIEGGSRIGGRISTSRVDGIQVEEGAELINENQTSIRGLARELGLHIKDVYAPGQEGLHFGFVFEGKRYDHQQLIKALAPLQEAMKRQIESLGGIDKTLQTLSRVNLSTYLEQNNCIPAWARQCIAGIFVTEYGRALEQIPAADLFYAGIAQLSEENPHIFGAGYGKFVIAEGSSSIPERMASKLDIKLQHKLTKIAFDGEKYTLTVEHNGQLSERVADIVVVAMPYTALRDVDFSGCNLSPERAQCIRKMTYGDNTKTFIAATTPGDALGDNVRYDEDVQGFVWNRHRDSSKRSDIATVYHGGPNVKAPDDSTVDAVNRNHGPGHRHVLGRSTWADNPLAGGSYSISNEHLPPQGRQIVEHPGLLFVGEHISLVAPSYMDSAVRSGLAAGHRIIRNMLKVSGSLPSSPEK